MRQVTLGKIDFTLRSEIQNEFWRHFHVRLVPLFKGQYLEVRILFYSLVVKYMERNVKPKMNTTVSFKVSFSVMCLTRLINYSEKVESRPLSCLKAMSYMYSTGLP